MNNETVLLIISAGVLSLAACRGDAHQDPDSPPPEQEEAADAGSDAGSDAEDGPQIVCKPGQVRCAGVDTLERCAPTGLRWDPSPCGPHQQCAEAACAGPCERLNEAPSSSGCSFYATSLYQYGGEDGPRDAVVVANPDPNRTASVELYFVPAGSNLEVQAEGPIELPPGESHSFWLPPDPTNYWNWSWFPSLYRSGAVHHVVSDLPVQAVLHVPVTGVVHSAATLLLPEHVMTGDYVVYSYGPHLRPSYFSVIALENQTTLRWWPTAATAGNALPLPFVDQGGMASSCSIGSTTCESPRRSSTIHQPARSISRVR